MVMLLVSMTGRAMTPPRSGFVQQEIKQGQKTVGFCSFVAYFSQLFFAC
jgi:hypothetical protein